MNVIFFGSSLRNAIEFLLGGRLLGDVRGALVAREQLAAAFAIIVPEGVFKYSRKRGKGR